MSALRLLSLVAVVALVGVTQAQVIGRSPYRPVSTVPISFPIPLPCPLYPDPCSYGADDLNALLLLAKSLEKSNNEVNSNDIINKLLNALIYTTTNAGADKGSCSGGKTNSGSGSGSDSGSKKNPPLIDLGLLTGDDLLNLMLAGQDVLRLDLGNGGGAVSKLVSGLV